MGLQVVWAGRKCRIDSLLVQPDVNGKKHGTVCESRATTLTADPYLLTDRSAGRVGTAGPFRLLDPEDHSGT